MRNRLVIIGAGGHGRVVADIASKVGYREIVFLDDVQANVAGKVSSFNTYTASWDFFVAIGSASVRKRIMQQLQQAGASLATLVHPHAVIGENVSIGMGTVVMAGAVINPFAKIGEGCIVNTCSSVDHDCRISQYTHISVGAHVCGTVTIGENTWIGAGAIISNNIHVTDNCMIGAGAVVIADIEELGTYVGVPAKKIK